MDLTDHGGLEGWPQKEALNLILYMVFQENRNF